jgi:hypothetical protein
MFEYKRLNVDDLHVLERAKEFAKVVEQRTKFRGCWNHFVCRRSVNSSAQNFIKAVERVLAEDLARASHPDKSAGEHS